MKYNFLDHLYEFIFFIVLMIIIIDHIINHFRITYPELIHLLKWLFFDVILR